MTPPAPGTDQALPGPWRGEAPTKPDLRAGIVMIAAMAVESGTVRSPAGQAVVTAYALGLCLALGRGRQACGLAAGYLLILGAQRLCILGGALPLVPFLGITLTLMAKAWPVYVMAWLVVSRLPMGEIMAALDRIHVRGTVLVVLIVIHRYVPALIGEIRVIRSAARLRHDEPAWRRWARHPLTQCEHLVVPVLMRTGRIADELSAVALCKGLDPGRRRSALVVPRLGALDLALAASAVAVVTTVTLLAG